MRVALYHFFPSAVWNRGGGEEHYERSLSELIAAGCDAVRFEPHRPLAADILHVFGSSIHVAELAVAAKAAGLRVVVSTIAYSERPSWQWVGAHALNVVGKAPLTFRLRRNMLQCADALVTSSEYELGQVCRRYGVSPPLGGTVKVAVDPDIAVGSARRFREMYGIRGAFVLQCGRVNNHKGQLRTVAAARRVGIPVVLLGGVDPSARKYGERVRAEVRRSSDVWWLGVDGADRRLIADAYAACSAHVLPSVSECPGLVNLEAAAAGKPVVAGRYPPLVEYLGDACCYVDPMSNRSIVRGIRTALDRPELGSQCKELVSSLSWQSAARELVDLYHQVSALPSER